MAKTHLPILAVVLGLGLAFHASGSAQTQEPAGTAESAQDEHHNAQRKAAIERRRSQRDALRARAAERRARQSRAIQGARAQDSPRWSDGDSPPVRPQGRTPLSVGHRRRATVGGVNAHAQSPLERAQRRLKVHQNRHNRRTARLSRIREIAEAAGDAETLSTVDNLVAREAVAWKKAKVRAQARLQRVRSQGTDEKPEASTGEAQ